MDLTEEDVAHEVACINNEDIWPLWPVLPMKRIGGFGDDDGHGILVASHKTRIYIMSLFELKPGPLKEQVAGRPVREFESVEAMVREGWVGD